MGCLMGKGNNIKRQVHGNKTQEADKALLEATLLIQRWYRKYRAKLEARRRASWQVFQSLEYKNEKDQMSLCNFFNDLLQHGKGDDNVLIKTLKSQESPSDEEDLLSQTDPNSIEVEPSYKGLHLIFPLDVMQIQRLTEFFANKQLLHAKYVLSILLQTRKLLKGMSSWNQVPLGNLPYVTVVGDIHGQIDDLLLIFYKNGNPDRMNPYVFNGDFVDRGVYSIEVALLIFAYFLLYPKSVYINRGNHEDQVMNTRYGFVTEAMDKYGAHSAKIVKLFAEVFSWLPLCTVIDKKILVCHGGISNKTNLAEIDKIERHNYMSVLNPPHGDENDGTAEKIDFEEWRQILDMLWSDPKSTDGCEPNTYRGGGCYFGPDVCEMVLKRHKFKLLIRSHECKPEGYDWDHPGLTLTIFSASNYYEEDSNKGAYLRINKAVTRGDAIPEIFQFQVRPEVQLAVSAKVAKTEDAALASLKEKIFTLKSELLKEFEKYDTNKTGKMTTTNWCECMTKVTGLDLPWRTLKVKLIKDADPESHYVDYHSMFVCMSLESHGKKVGSDMEALYKHRTTLTHIFNTIDQDRSGFISQNEFIEACKVLRKATNNEMSDKDIKSMARQMDINQDGHIDINEFLESFTLVTKR